MYIKLVNGSPIPYSTAQLRRDNPNTSFPAVMSDAVLARHDIYKVTVLPMPAYDTRTHYAKESAVHQVEGQWVMGYTVEPLPKSQASENMKAERNKRLSESDWVVAKAAEVQNPAPPEWVAYRQQLRDVTSQVGFPFNIVWPVKPE
jgi:hypothetical protein